MPRHVPRGKTAQARCAAIGFYLQGAPGGKSNRHAHGRLRINLKGQVWWQHVHGRLEHEEAADAGQVLPNPAERRGGSSPNVRLKNGGILEVLQPEGHS